MERFVIFVIGLAMLLAVVAPSDDSPQPPPPEAAPPVVADAPAADQGPSAPDDYQQAAIQPAPASDQPTTIDRGPDGQFHIDAAVNGQQLGFLVDTGATVVALTVDDARRLGLSVDPQNFAPVGMGAGGAVKGQHVSLNSFSVAGHDIGQLDAVVLEGLTTNLLGQSVLKQVARLELSGDRMVIH